VSSSSDARVPTYLIGSPKRLPGRTCRFRKSGGVGKWCAGEDADSHNPPLEFVVTSTYYPTERIPASWSPCRRRGAALNASGFLGEFVRSRARFIGGSRSQRNSDQGRWQRNPQKPSLPSPVSAQFPNPRLRGTALKVCQQSQGQARLPPLRTPPWHAVNSFSLALGGRPGPLS